MGHLKCVVRVAIAMLVSVGSLPAQVVRGFVVLRDSVTPVPGAVVIATDPRGATAGRTLTSTRGEFTLRLPSEGRYDLKVLRIGFRPTLAPAVTVAAGATATVRIVFAGEAITLSAINVRERETCRVNADTGFMVTRVWEEARTAMLSSQLSIEGAPLFAELIEYDRTLDSAGRYVRQQHVHTSRNPTTHAFRSRSAQALDSAGYVVADSTGTTYYAPDAEVLLSDSFAAGHCFHLERAPAGSPNLIGVGFTPARDRRDIREITGTLWLDRQSAELRTLEFQYTNLPDVVASVRPGGRVEFLRLRDGNWLVSRWNVRMPQVVAAPRASADGLRRTIRSSSPIVVQSIQVTGGEVTRVTRHDSLVYASTGPHIELQVRSADSLVGAAGAVLTLEGTDYTATANETGRLHLSPVLAGRYRAQVRTSLMDSLGMPGVSQEIETRDDGRVDTLTLPRARDLLRRVCSRDSVEHGEGMLRGTVRNERATAINQAAVVVTWQTSFDIIGNLRADQVRFTEKTIGGYTDSGGSWRLCGVPRNTVLTVSVVSDSGSDVRKTRLNDDFGTVDLVARRDGAASVAGGGNQQTALVELAVFNLQGAPLPDATIEIQPPSGRPRTVVTGPTGRALVPDLAPGLLTIKTRRMGFKQGQVAVTVEAGRNTVPIILGETSLPTLDTVRVVGGRRAIGRLDEFETRRLNHTATVSLTRDDIVKRNPTSLWQMLTNIPSIKLIDRDGMVIAISTRTVVTSILDQGPCHIAVAVNGVMVSDDPSHGEFDLRGLPAPEEIHGVEVFAGASSIPLQYGGVGKGKWCGLIAIWTR